MTAAFNIGTQQAGAIYQAAGNQTIHHGGGTLTADALSAVADLRNALEETALPPGARLETGQALEDVESELQAPAPDPGVIAGGVKRITAALAEVGALASAGEALVSPLRLIASFGGAAGAAALRLLA